MQCSGVGNQASCLDSEAALQQHSLAQPQPINNNSSLCYCHNQWSSQCRDRLPPPAMSFGFSAGDFISALELVTTVVNALRESGGSSAEYHALIKQLYALESALIRVKQLEVDDAQHAEVVALRQAAAQCQNTIDTFWEKIKKYQPSLRAGGSGSRVKDSWKKIKWVWCKKEDVVKFKADLMAHTESIDILLTTIHM